MYYDAYDLPNYYLKIEDPLYCHIFTIVFLILLTAFIIFDIKLIIETHKIRRERKAIDRRIEKLLFGNLGDKDKNKKLKNIS
jgi:hypothetical protein